MSDARNSGIEGVDFYAAIQAHVLWRIRLEAYISGTGEQLNPEIVGRENHCALGEWIYGSGSRAFGNHPQFPELKDAHARFHRCAGEVIRCADSGHAEKARELLRGEYAVYSQKVKANLARLGLELKRD